MNIMHIISADIWAGAEVQVYHTVTALSKQPHIIVTCVVFNDGILKEKLEKKNIDIIFIDENKYSNLSLLCVLKKIIKQKCPDLLHVHAVKEHFIGWLASLLCYRKISIVRTVHGARKVPTALSLFKSFRSNTVVFLDNFLINNAAGAIIAVSKNLEQDLSQNKIRGVVSQIYNAIDVAELDFIIDKQKIRKKYFINDVFWIGTAARLVEPKNLQMLIKAGYYLNKAGINFKISIFGDGPLKDDLQNLIDYYSLSNKITLHGFESDIIPIIQSLDVFVLCSFHEGLPMALLESLYLKTPVVCTAVGGITEVIENEKNGLLIPTNDEKALANFIIKIKKDKVLSNRIANNGRKTIEKRFLLSKTTKHLLSLYSKVLNREEVCKNECG